MYMGLQQFFRENNVHVHVHVYVHEFHTCITCTCTCMYNMLLSLKTLSNEGTKVHNPRP